MEEKNQANPEIGESIITGGFKTNYHDVGSGDPVVLIHGSGPGVSAWANWRLVIPKLAARRRVIAPDMVGFGYTERPENIDFNMDMWGKQLVDFLDALNLEQVDLVGNSFGGALALWMAIYHPDRIHKLVLMGSMGTEFKITKGLDHVWGYQPSLEAMRVAINSFVYDKAIATEDLVKMRYEASIRPGYQETFGRMFPAPRQKGVDMMASKYADIAAIRHETLIIHGREDEIIPIETSMTLFQLIPNAQLHMFGKCGHWTQIEQNLRFVAVVEAFLAGEF
ncbi:2-hydroxy-6-oxo-2,4-heptadienoate hydrolase [Smithella sp. SCADC]|jgi:2-hydroxymuconate-semialdehyde hydrolase|uniref:2-hydroxy-6-oxo-2,4-heptadienoate hydrolase n=1 Tax=uncultured spirochete TaxID=156406 RepID=A0A3P3XGY5_9SPIR|nr:alpha/beta hydrolase [Rectinema subterraneum]KFO68250.1 2-hydroxy-6-oxo-2,4-heptadienoate hydrolase [Smithella sp. SCADC]SLM11559.1 2-hydroxy-6-oxo-2,4-heptadienoate hydrolase [uncultured spirochete]